MTLRRGWVKASFRDKFENLTPAQRTLPLERFGYVEKELEVLAMWSAVEAKRKSTPSLKLVVTVTREMLGVFRKAWQLVGRDANAVEERTEHALRRFDEYDQATGRYRHSSALGISAVAIRNCFGREKDLKAGLELLSFVGYFVKVCQGSLAEILSDQQA